MKRPQVLLCSEITDCIQKSALPNYKPEFLQEACTPEALAGAVEDLLRNSSARERQVAAIDLAARKLGEGEAPASSRAARAILQLLAKGRQASSPDPQGVTR